MIAHQSRPLDSQGGRRISIGLSSAATVRPTRSWSQPALDSGGMISQVQTLAATPAAAIATNGVLPSAMAAATTYGALPG